jgi:hypothetical protein
VRLREELENEFAAAKRAWGGDKNKFAEYSRFTRAEKARRQFYAKRGLQMPNA